MISPAQHLLRIESRFAIRLQAARRRPRARGASPSREEMRRGGASAAPGTAALETARATRLVARGSMHFVGLQPRQGRGHGAAHRVVMLVGAHFRARRALVALRSPAFRRLPSRGRPERALPAAAYRYPQERGDHRRETDEPVHRETVTPGRDFIGAPDARRRNGDETSRAVDGTGAVLCGHHPQRTRVSTSK